MRNANPSNSRCGYSDCLAAGKRARVRLTGITSSKKACLGLCGTGERDDADHPALLVLGLEASEIGCRWLLDRWNELRAVIDDEGSAWQAPERFKAIRLLRLDTRDVMHAPAVIAILQACQMLDPDAGGLVEAFWNELLAANAGWSMERLRAWVPEMSLPADQAGCAAGARGDRQGRDRPTRVQAQRARRDQ